MSTASLQSQRSLQSDVEFSRNDWQIYISNLTQRAGVVGDLIRQLVLKELADNALDEMDRVGRPGEVTISRTASIPTPSLIRDADSPIRPKSLPSASPSRRRW